MNVTMNKVTDFYKTLVQWGGAFKVEDKKILYVSDNEPLTVKVGDDTKEMMVLHEEMERGNYAYFNPLVETMGHTAEKKWFMTSRNHIIGFLIHGCIAKMIEIGMEGDEAADSPGYDALELSEAYIGKTDAKMLKELDHIPITKLIRLVYSRPKRTAQLQTNLFDDDYIESLKWRKKTIRIIRSMFSDIMSSDELHKDFKYRAKELNMPQIECVVNIMSKMSDVASEHAAALLGVNLFPTEMALHVPNIKEYRTKCSWAVASTVMKDKEDREQDHKGGVSVGTSPFGTKRFGSRAGVVPSTLSFGAAAVRDLNAPVRQAYGGGVSTGGVVRFGAPAPQPATRMAPVHTGARTVADRFTSVPGRN